MLFYSPDVIKPLAQGEKTQSFRFKNGADAVIMASCLRPWTRTVSQGKHTSTDYSSDYCALLPAIVTNLFKECTPTTSLKYRNTLLAGVVPKARDNEPSSSHFCTNCLQGRGMLKGHNSCHSTIHGDRQSFGANGRRK